MSQAERPPGVVSMSHRVKVLSILLLAVAVRVALLAVTSDSAFLSIDGKDYQDIASNLAAGNGYSISFYRWFEPEPPNPDGLHPDFFRPPLLPFLGAPLYWLPGPWILWAKSTVLLLGVLLVLLGYLIAKECFGRQVALLSGLLLALYPYAIWYSARWSTETLMAVCLLGAVLLLLRARPRPTRTGSVGAGVLLALATLSRPNALLQALVLPIVLVSRRTHRPRWPHIAIQFLALMFVLAPWSLRNLKLAGSPNPGTFFGPYNMWLGTNPRMAQMYAAGTSPGFNDLQEALYRIDSAGHVREQERLAMFDVRSTSAYWLRQVRDYAVAEPGQVLRIYAARFLHFLRPWPNPATSSRPIFLLSLLFVGPLLICAAWSLIRLQEVRRAALHLPILLGLIGSVPFVFSLRLRFPVFDPYIILIAAPTVWLCIQRAKRSKALPGFPRNQVRMSASTIGSSEIPFARTVFIG